MIPSRALLTLLAASLLLLTTVSSSSPATVTPSTALSTPTQPGPRILVFLIAGQSNAVGYNSDPLTSEDDPNPRILQLSCCRNTTTLPLAQCYLNVSADPLAPCLSGNPHVGFGRSFARSLLPSLHPADLVLLVPGAIGFTGFLDGTWPAYTGTGFQLAVAKLRRTWALLAEGAYAKYTRLLSGVLWHQGEYDAGDNFVPGRVVNGSVYLERDIGPLIAAFRNTTFLNFSSPTLPFVAGQMLPSWVDNSTHPVRQGVKLALALLTQYVAYTGFADSYGLLGDPVFRSGIEDAVIHFTARSQRLFGRRYAAAYEAARVNYPEQPPSGGGVKREEDMGSIGEAMRRERCRGVLEND